MAKKEEKKDEKKAKEPLTPEQQAAAAKKKKIILAALAGLLVVGGGAFAALKILGSSDKKTVEENKTNAATSGENQEGEHADSPEGSEDGHAGDAKDAKTEKTDSSKDTASKGHEGAKAEDQSKSDGHSSSDPHAKPAGHDEGKDAAGSSGKSGRYSGIGLMYDMKPFHLNLGNPLENRYVRLELRFEYPNEDQKPELVARDSQIRDAVVSIVSRKTREHLLSPDGKDQLRLEIKNRVNQYLEKKVTNVYITDILIE